MEHKQYAVLLFNDLRETLETMAFAEVIPCSLRFGDQELDQLDFVANGSDSEPSHAGAVTDVTADENDAWGASPAFHVPPGADAFDDADDTGWGDLPAQATPPPDDTAEWGKITSAATDDDPWGDGSSHQTQSVTGIEMTGRDVQFDQLVERQADWVWSCMRVNSEEVHSVWFIISKDLAFRLAESMYAGESIELDSPIIRDLVAELTNVLGGKLMLLLEEQGGKFTLAVPEIGIGMPPMPDSYSLETILCKVLVDSEYPVMTSICFNEGV